MHPGAGGGNLLDVLHALRRFQDGVDHDGLLDARPCFKLRQQLVEVMNVPCAFHLGQHHHVQLVTGLQHDAGDVIERPGAVQAVDPRPQARLAIVVRQRHLDEAVTRGLLGICRNGVFQVAQNHVHLSDEIRHLGAHLYDVGRQEVDHPLQLDRHFAHRLRRADGKRLVELAGEFHGLASVAILLLQCNMNR